MMVISVVIACMVACSAGEALKQARINLYLDPASEEGRSCVKRIGAVVDIFSVEPDAIVAIDVNYIGHGQQVKEQLCVRKVLSKRLADATDGEGLNFYFNLNKRFWWRFLMCQASDTGENCFSHEYFADSAVINEIAECVGSMKDDDELIKNSNEAASANEATSGCLVTFGSPSLGFDENIWESGAACTTDVTTIWTTDTEKAKKECVRFWAVNDSITAPQKPKQEPSTQTIVYYVRQKCLMLNPLEKDRAVSQCRGKDIA